MSEWMKNCVLMFVLGSVLLRKTSETYIDSMVGYVGVQVNCMMHMVRSQVAPEYFFNY
jgi:hypothetical protein